MNDHSQTFEDNLRPAGEAGDAADEATQKKGLSLWRKRGGGGGGGGKQKAEEVSESVAASHFFTETWMRLKRHFTLIMVFSAAINLLYLAPSIFMLQVYDRVIPSSGQLTLVFLCIVLLFALASMSLLDSARARLLARAGLRIERLGASTIMRQMLAARRDGQQIPGAGVRDLDTLKQGISSPATIGLIDLPWTPLFIGICFMLHFWIGMLALGGAGIILGLALLNERASRRSLTTLASKSQQFHVAHESDLISAETVFAIGADSALLRRRLETREDLVNAQMDQALSSSTFSALTKFTRQVLQSGSLALGAYLAIERQISPGAIIACSILTARAYAPVEQIVGGWRQVGLAFTAYGNLRKLLGSAPPQQERTPLPTPKGNIRVESIFATPPGASVLAVNNISFQANAGEVVAIIGPSGAGKTALARVLANAAQPRSGTVRIDGARYADWDAKALSRHIGYMPQKVDLFDGTVSDNISRFARNDGLAMDQVGPMVVEAAMAAGAHELILGLPNGYETMLGANGAGLSPGQSQRIALARALFGNPCVVVLDEPNSHLDGEGELALVNALERCKERGALAFVVAHRSGVISVVDRIMVLNRGQIVAYGPRDEVLSQLQSGRLGTSSQPQPSVQGQPNAAQVGAGNVQSGLTGPALASAADRARAAAAQQAGAQQASAQQAGMQQAGPAVSAPAGAPQSPLAENRPNPSNVPTGSLSSGRTQ